MVGERILLTLPSGDTSSADMNIYYEGRKEFLDEYGPENRKIIEIRDYSRIVGFPNKQARLDQTRHLLEEKNNLLTFMITSAPIYIRLVFRVGLKLNPAPYPILFVNGYKNFIYKAIAILDNSHWENLEPNMLQHPDSYNFEINNFKVVFAIIPKKVIYVKGYGTPDKKSTIELCKRECELFNKYMSDCDSIFKIADYSEVKSSGFIPRFNYSRHLKKLYENGSRIKETYVIGASRFTITAITMAKKVINFKTIFVEKLEDAFQGINRYSQKSYLKIETNSTDEGKKDEKIFSKNDIDDKVDDLLDFMGSLTWERPLDSYTKVNGDNVFKPIFDALAVIKNDIDNLLEERKNDAEKLKKTNRLLELDIKAREKAEAERSELEDQLHQSEKMQAIGQLAGGIAHDFNNQLAAIVGYNDLLNRNIKDDSKLKRYTENIKIVSHRAKDLTGQLLAFARKGKYHSMDVNIHELINEVSSLSSHTMDKKIIFLFK